MGSFLDYASRKNRLSIARCGLLIWVVLAHLAATTSVAQVPFRRIARTGDPVPGEPGHTFDFIGAAAIDTKGAILFRASVDGAGTKARNDDRILFGRPGYVEVVTESGSAPAFGDDAQLSLSPNPELSAAGRITYEARVVGDGITIDGELVFSGPPSNPQLVIRSGHTPPGVEGSLYIRTLSATNSPHEALVVSGNLVPFGQSDAVGRGIWAGSPGDLGLVARTGGPAPGVPPGVTFTTASVLAPSLTINRRGAVAFPAFLEGTGVDQTNNAGIWAGTADDLSLVMRAGDPAPGVGSGVRFVGRPEYAIANGNDRVMFPAFLAGNGIDANNDYGLWVGEASGGIALLAREGDEPPLLGSDYSVTNVFPYIQTEDDRIAMVTSFNGPGITPDNDQAIFWGGPGNWEVLFREGDAAPGLPEGVVLDFDVDIPKIAIRETGAAAMILGLDGPGVTDADDRALFWRRSESEPWNLVAREGHDFDGSPIIDGGLFIHVGGGGAGGSQSLTNDGLLAFRARSDGGSTAVYLVPSPAPAWFLFAAAVLTGLARRFRIPNGTALLSAFALGLQIATPVNAQVQPVRIARTGDPAPGEPGLMHTTVNGPAIDANGNLVINGGVTGPGINGGNNGRIWHWERGSMRVVVAEGPAPQFGEGVRLTPFPGVGFSQSGQVSFEASLSGDSITNDGELILAGSPSTLQVAMRSGMTPPGVEPGLRVDSINPLNGPTDVIAVTGNLVANGSGTVVGRAMWSGQPDDLGLVARSGALAPGVPPGVTFTTASVLAPSLTINRRGALAFPAFLEGAGIDLTNNAGIWAGTADDLSLVMRAGDPAPGTPPGVNFVGRPEYAIINGNDRVMFPAFVAGDGVDTSNDFGLWVGEASGGITLLAREGDGPPLLGSDYSVTNVYPYIQTEDDRVAMVTSFSGPGVTPDNDQAIFWGGPGNWEILFREGEHAPGLSDGVVLDFDVDIPKIAIRETGAAAMILGLDGQGVSDADDRALFWRRSESAPWTLVAREGFDFDGSTVSDGGLFFYVGGGGAGGSQSLTDDGLLVFHTRSVEGFTAIYLVPAPAPAWLLFAAAAIVRRFRRP